MKPALSKMQRIVFGLSTGVGGLALSPQSRRFTGRETGKTAMMKIQHRNDNQPRRLPVPEMGLALGAEDGADKGRKHEAFDTGFYSGERRGLARAMRLDRKR